MLTSYGNRNCPLSRVYQAEAEITDQSLDRPSARRMFLIRIDNKNYNYINQLAGKFMKTIIQLI
mgnify:CR=1 FL=1